MKIPSRAVLRITQTVLLMAVIILSSWLFTVSYAGAGPVVIDDAVEITVLPSAYAAPPGATITVTVIIGNPSPSATFIATGCILWYRAYGLAWTLSPTCDVGLNFPYYFPPNSVEVWIFSQTINPTAQPVTASWRILGVGYWGTLGPRTTSLTPALSQYAFFSLTIL